jgi:hypothetical protein
MSDDLVADPFHERSPCPHRMRIEVLGGRFEVESNSRSLLRLVETAFGKLPAHVLTEESPPTFSVRLFLSASSSHADSDFGEEPPRMQLHSGPGTLCGAMDAANFAVVSPAQRTALLVVSRSMLRFRYHLRYELIEFVFYTLAARVQQLVSLHGACIGRNGRGILLIGASGGGKSTLALHSLLHGLELIAEDGILATPDTLLATGIGSFLHLREDSLGLVNERTASRIRKSPVIQRRSGVEKFEIDLRRTRHSLARQPLQIASVVVLTKKRTAHGEDLLRRLNEDELQRQLDASQPYALGQPGWSQFRQHLLRVGGYELRRGQHPDEGVAALETLLGSRE